MRVAVCQHVPYEFVGSMAEWFAGRAATVSVCRLFAGDSLPALDDTDWLVMMGGPMSVNDEQELPWLVAEKQLVRDALAAGKTVLGVCLGAQLIASALGATVRPNAVREIGWLPVTPVDGPPHPLRAAFPGPVDAFHWHGETFALPPGATWLARTEGCAHQAFAIGPRVLGLQFHPEMTLPIARELVAHAAPGELGSCPTVQSAGQILAPPERFAAANRQMARLLDLLAAG